MYIILLYINAIHIVMLYDISHYSICSSIVYHIVAAWSGLGEGDLAVQRRSGSGLPQLYILIAIINNSYY